MYLDEDFAAGGGHSGSWCCACKQPIQDGERTKRVDFSNDPTGDKGLTGDYHLLCARPFVSLARVVNLNPWRGF